MAVIGLGLAAGAAWWLQRPAQAPAAGAPKPANAGGGPPAVEVVRVSTARIQDDAQAVGSLRSRQSVTLKPEVAGRVVNIGFADGARVKRGQLLVQLDDVLPRAELSQAQAQLSIARANLQRNQDLVAQNFVAQRVLDESQASLQVAEAQVALAQARLQRMRIVAPFDGTVGLRRINLGEFVKDGADLVNLEDTSSLTVDFRLPERYQSRIAVGQTVQVQLDALPGKRFDARVQALDPLLDADGRSIAVRAALPASAADELRPGMFARVLTVFAVDEAALVVPEEAIVPQGGKQFVIRIETEGEGDAIKRLSRRTEVQLGVRRGAQVQVTSGLRAGDTVVVAGQQRLQKDGTAVRVVDMAGAAETAVREPGAGPAPAAAAAR
jgi:membrane fusion protein (multidrug efflux system)